MIRRALLVSALLAMACTRASKPLPQNPPRIGDSPPEQRAALDEAARLGLPAEQRRFGVEEQKELRRQDAERAQDQKNRTAVIPMPSPNGASAPVDAGAER